MVPSPSFTAADEGKHVLNQNDETVGRVVGVEGDRAYVDPAPAVTAATMSRLGWGSREERSYPLESDDVADITDDAVRVSSL